MNRKALLLLSAALLTTGCLSALAQSPTDVPETPFVKQIHRFDLGISGTGVYNSTATGFITPTQAPNYGNGSNSMTQFASNTAAPLATLRYVAKPWVGLEFNYGFARYTENYQGPAAANFPAGFFQVQTRATEYTLGYIATPQIYKPYGLQPYIGGGAGSMAFKPTPAGGQGLPEKARMMYYYTLGVQDDLTPHFGLRAGFREVFFLAPDFGQNYLTILKHVTTYEPQIGFYLHY